MLFSVPRARLILQWLEADVMEATDDGRGLVHFRGFSRRFDVWVLPRGGRVRRFGPYRHINRSTVEGASRGAGGGGSGERSGRGADAERHHGGGAEAAPAPARAPLNAGHVFQLTNMGFPEDQARAALRHAGGNLHQAVEILTGSSTQVKQPICKVIAFFLASTILRCCHLCIPWVVFLSRFENQKCWKQEVRES